MYRCISSDINVNQSNKYIILHTVLQHVNS